MPMGRHKVRRQGSWGSERCHPLRSIPRPRSSGSSWITLLPLALAFSCSAGCAHLKDVCDRGCVSYQVQQRTGYDIGPPPHACEIVLPPGVCLDDGLTEDEAVILALWNNAAFQEVLVDLQ